MAFCSECGSKLQDDALFCSSCGKRVKKVGEDKIVPKSNPINQETPIFTPPNNSAPIFTPPRESGVGGAVCFHHTSEPAVAGCARCGKYVCKDCAEAYGVVSGEYAGKCLCFDCCQELVAQNVRDLTVNKNKIKTQFILSIIGMVIGFVLGMSAGITSGSIGVGLLAGIIYACIGGVFLTALKMYLLSMWEAIKMCFSGKGGWIAALIFIMIQGVVIAVKCIIATISNTIYYINYLKRTSGFIEEDSAALQQMRDYMEYTLVRNQNKGIDLDSLMNEGSQLYNNSYARSVRNNGEQAADAVLRQATTRIAENGEIIRDFHAAA